MTTTSSTPSGPPATSSTTVELAIGGMTCASCANRVERTLNTLDGVSASVNYATEKARVHAPAGLDPQTLVAQVEAAGYTAALARPPASANAGADSLSPATGGAQPDPTRALRERLIVAAVLSVPVVAMAMVPALQFTYWQWISLALAAPVVVWGAWPFHRAAWANLRHAAATMDTLVSMGVTAAFAWSLWALLFGTAGVPGTTHPFALTVVPSDGAATLYLDVAAGVTTFLLAGRYMEARARRRAGAALRALLELGAKDVTVLRVGSDGTAAESGSRPTTSPWVTGSSCAPARRSPPTASSRTARPPSTRRCSPASRYPSRSGRALRSPGPRSTPAGGSSCARPGSVRTRSSRRWRAWSRKRRAARPRPSGWPTGSPGCSCRSSSRSPPRPSGSGSAPAAASPSRSPPRSPC